MSPFVLLCPALDDGRDRVRDLCTRRSRRLQQSRLVPDPLFAAWKAGACLLSPAGRQTGDRPRPPPGQLSATGCAGGRPGERKTQLADECGPRMGQKTYAVGAVTRPWSEGPASGSRPGRFWPGGPGSGRPSPRRCPRPRSIWTDRGDRYTRAPCAWD